MEAGEFAVFRGAECRNNDDFSGLVVHSETSVVLDLYDPRYEIAHDIDVTGVYRHYKSTPDDERLYLVHTAIRDTETEDVLVMYEPLYEANNLFYVRPLDIFSSTVVDHHETKRFERIF